MTTKALITRRASGGAEVARATERSAAQSLNLEVEHELPHATLVRGAATELAELEKQGFRVKLLPDTNLIRLGRWKIDIEGPALKLPRGLSVPKGEQAGWLHHLVQFVGPIQAEWLAELEQHGIDVVEPVGPYGVFVNAATDAIAALKALSFVAWTGLFQPAWRVHDNLAGRKGRIRYVSIGVYPDSESASVVAALAASGGTVVRDSLPTEHGGRYHRIVAELDAKAVPGIAVQRGVRWMEYASDTPGYDGEREVQILAENFNGAAPPNTAPVVGYQGWLTGAGISGNGVTVAIVDTGVDQGANNNATGHLDLRGRQQAFVDYTGGATVIDNDGHGTHVAGIAVGNGGTGLTEGPAPGDFLFGQGVAPQARYVTQNFTQGPWPPANIGQFATDANANGASVTNSSWTDLGGAGAGYVANARRLDQAVRDCDPGAAGLQPLTLVFSAGNSGPNAMRITSPKEAKNIICVGNSLTSRPGGAVDDVRGIANSSSRGPAVDGRLLPNVVAPGTDVSSARSSQCPVPATPNTVCSLPAVAGTGNAYVLASGTSMASPHVTGTCALLIEWWRARTGGRNPSPALLKALLVNGAEDLAGGPDGNGGGVLANIPNNSQGWGRVSLDNMLFQAPASDRGPRIYSDQRHAFTAAGQEFNIRVAPVDPTRPLRITLVWTDAAGAAGANPALVNDLDLEVTQGASTWRGNVFANGFSTVGGAFDHLNNIECVYIQNPAGTYDVSVIAGVIAASARPDIATPWQDFALVMENAEVPPAAPVSVVPVIDRSGSMIFYGYEAVTRTTSKQFVDLLGVDDSYGIVSFGDDGVVEYPPGAMPTLQTITGQATREAGKAEVDGMAFGGCTFMGDGINKGRDLIAGATTAAKALVLFSDGYDNKGCDMANPAKPTAMQAVATLPAGLPVYSCAMGPSSDQALLGQIASATGGRYYFMPTIDDLYEIYNYIRGQVTGDSIIANESTFASSSRVAAFVDARATEATFTVAWGNPKLRFVADEAKKADQICVRLRDPRGRLLHPHDSNVRRTVGQGYVLFELQEPAPGQWFMEVSTQQEGHTRYTAAGFVRSPIRIQLSTTPKVLVPGKSLGIVLRAWDGKQQLTGLRASSVVSAPQMGLPTLLKKFRGQLADIKPPKLPKGDSLPKQIQQLMVLRDRLLQAGKPDLLARIDTKLALAAVDSTTLVGAGVPASAATPGTLLGTFAGTGETGSYNLVVSATGSSGGTRFVRKEMISVIAQ